MLFVGDGAKRADMEQMVKDLNLTDSVTFTGRIHDRKAIAKIYLRSSAMLFPSLYDTSSLVPREAAACGCPTVFVKGASTSQGITEKNGFLIDDTADSLAETVRHIIHKPEEAKLVGETARNTVYRSWQNAVEDAYERYLYLIDLKKSRLAMRAE
jgi:glycosyltransferase involved in cell wall biosynthesis